MGAQMGPGAAPPPLILPAKCPLASTMSSYRTPIRYPLRLSSYRTPIRYPRWGTGRGAATDATPLRNRPGTYSTTTRRGVSCGRPMGRGAAPPPLVMPAQCRLAGEVPSCRTPIRYPLRLSSYRTPIRYPRWGTGRGAATDATPLRNRPGTYSTTTRRGVSCGRPMGRGAAPPPLVMPAQCRLAGEVPSCRTPIRYPRWGAATDATPFLKTPSTLTGEGWGEGQKCLTAINHTQLCPSRP